MQSNESAYKRVRRFANATSGDSARKQHKFSLSSTVASARFKRSSEGGRFKSGALSYYDFLTANPLLMITNEYDADRNRLIMCGFDGRALSYASPSQRFTTRRERLQHDLAKLISYGLVNVVAAGSVKYFITSAGHDLASEFTAMYARAYRTSADIVVKRLAKLSDKRLRENAREWIAISPHSARPEVIDLLFAVNTYFASETDPELAEATDAGSRRDAD